MQFNMLLAKQDMDFRWIDNITSKILTMPLTLSANTKKIWLKQRIEVFCQKKDCYGFISILFFTPIAFILYYLSSLMFLCYKILIRLARLSVQSLDRI